MISALSFRLTKCFGTKTVLDDFALEVRGGEFVTFLGPSGCGKSTALNLLAGLLPPTSGEIRLDGAAIDRMPPERRGFGMVFQNYALFPHLTVFDNVGFGLALRSRPRSEIAQRVARMLDLVRLAEFGERYPGQLSGGQQQRVAIARALAVEPRVLLLDEPLSNLDAKLRIEMRAEIKRLHAGLGLTSIYVTHDQAEALSLSDRVVVLRDGRVMQVGTPAEIHDRPRTRFVADFMGYRNFFPVTVDRGEPGEMTLARGKDVTLSGRSVTTLASGADAVAAIRPEDVELTMEPAGPNVVRGTVRLIEYLGREHDVEVALDSEQTVMARVQRPVDIGSIVSLRLPPERVVILPSDHVGGA